MIAARHRFPSRGTAAVRTHIGPMATPLPREAPGAGMTGSGVPPQDLVGTGIRELLRSMLDAATAVRLGATSSDNTQTNYQGTVLPAPVQWQLAHAAAANSESDLQAGIAQSGNAPQMANKTASEGVAAEPLRPAANLPHPGKR